jgi:hypothetical protein
VNWLLEKTQGIFSLTIFVLVYFVVFRQKRNELLMYAFYTAVTILLIFLYKINIYTILLAMLFLLFVGRRWYLTHRECRHPWKIKIRFIRWRPKPVTICLICGIVKPIKDKRPTLSESKNHPKGFLSLSPGRILLSIVVLVTGTMGIVNISSNRALGPSGSAAAVITIMLMMSTLFITFLNPFYTAIARNKNASRIWDPQRLKTKALLTWIVWMVALLVIGKF